MPLVPKTVKTTNIKPHKGQKVIELAYKRKRGFKPKQIEKAVKQFRRDMKKRGKDGRVQVSLLTNQNWRNTRTLPLASVKHNNILQWYAYGDTGQDLNNIVENNTTVPAFRVYFIPNPSRRGGDSEGNHCLWFCLRNAIIGKELHKSLDKPYKLKRYLKLGKNDKVPIDCIPQLEKRLELNINVEGDYTHTSKNEYPRSCTLILKDGHYTLKKEQGIELKGISYKERKPVVYQRTTEGYTYYDGHKLFRKSVEWHREQISKPMSSKYLLIKIDRKLTLQETYDNWIKSADKLKEASNGLINLYKTGTYKREAFRLFKLMSNHQAPEPIDQLEAEFIRKCTYGAIIYGDKGKVVEDARSYDVNSMYPSILKSMYTMVPMKRGEFKHLKEIPNSLGYGIYRAVVKEANPKLFRINPDNYYTHRDIRRAIELGYSVELVQDEQANALVYTMDKTERGNRMFSKYVDTLYKLKQEGIKEVKPILNILWGAMSEVDRRKTMVRENTEDTEVGFVDQIVPYKGAWLVKHIDFNHYYMTNYARLAPFMLSFGRDMISKAVEKVGAEKVYRIHTDSLLIEGETKALELSPTALGKFKIEKQGTATIKDANNVVWN